MTKYLFIYPLIHILPHPQSATNTNLSNFVIQKHLRITLTSRSMAYEPDNHEMNLNDHFVYTTVHTGGRLIPSRGQHAMISTHVYEGGRRQNWRAHAERVREIHGLLNQLFHYNDSNVGASYFFEVVPPNGGPRTLRALQRGGDAVALAAQGRTVALINIFITEDVVDELPLRDGPESSVSSAPN